MTLLSPGSPLVDEGVAAVTLCGDQPDRGTVNGTAAVVRDRGGWATCERTTGKTAASSTTNIRATGIRGLFTGVRGSGILRSLDTGCCKSSPLGNHHSSGKETLSKENYLQSTEPSMSMQRAL